MKEFKDKMQAKGHKMSQTFEKFLKNASTFWRRKSEIDLHHQRFALKCHDFLEFQGDFKPKGPGNQRPLAEDLKMQCPGHCPKSCQGDCQEDCQEGPQDQRHWPQNLTRQLEDECEEDLFDKVPGEGPEEARGKEKPEARSQKQEEGPMINCKHFADVLVVPLLFMSLPAANGETTSAKHGPEKNCSSPMSQRSCCWQLFGEGVWGLLPIKAAGQKEATKAKRKMEARCQKRGRSSKKAKQTRKPKEQLVRKPKGRPPEGRKEKKGEEKEGKPAAQGAWTRQAIEDKFKKKS